MPIDSDLMQQLLETFRIQLEERLQVLSECLITLEQGVDEAKKELLLNDMFRAAHNIKGASRGVGLEVTSELSHALETLFSVLRRGGVTVEPEMIDLCLGAVDALRISVQHDAGGDSGSVGELLTRLAAAAEGRMIPASEPVVAPVMTGSDSIRLPVERLDRIAGLADELQLSKIRVDDHHQAARHLTELGRRLSRFWGHFLEGADAAIGSGLERHMLSEGTDLVMEIGQIGEALSSGLRATVGQLRPLAITMRDDVRSLRMLPAENILRPLERTVRDIARTKQKEVRFHLKNAHVEMDRAVLDLLRDPLVHLLRNAVDHGIEPAAERQAAGKPKEGSVTVDLVREGGVVVLTVEDDGAGVSLERVRQRIIQKKLASAEEVAQMDRQTLVDYLFRPGFSTRQQADEISGRGVGLDVVRMNLQAINGQVTVDFSPTSGTRFTLTVPLTLAADQGLLVGCAGQVLAIPSQYVLRILHLNPEQIIDLEGRQAINLEDDTIPIRNLAGVLSMHEEARAYREHLDVVVVNYGWSRMALLVDYVWGDREMVIKPLSPPLSNLRHIAGGTLGREGDVILVLNVADLLSSESHVSSNGGIATEAPKAQQRPAARILVVDDSITTRTLEMSILESHGYRVQAVVDGRAALERLRLETFDLVITDVEMPGINGFELTRSIRQDLGLTELPVVIVTSLGSDEDRRKGVEVRADAYIVKSDFETRELLDVVAQLT